MRDDELKRLQTLHGYRLLDTPPEPEFDEIVLRAAERFKVPIALLSLVDTHRQWFKAKVGIDARETPRSVSFCAHAIEDSGVMVVSDATLDERFHANPLVTGDPGIRFYAGAPVIAEDGSKLGTICVIDREPRHEFDDCEKEELRKLSAELTQLLISRKGTPYGGG